MRESDRSEMPSAAIAVAVKRPSESAATGVGWESAGGSSVAAPISLRVHPDAPIVELICHLARSSSPRATEARGPAEQQPNLAAIVWQTPIRVNPVNTRRMVRCSPGPIFRSCRTGGQL